VKKYAKIIISHVKVNNRTICSIPLSFLYLLFCFFEPTTLKRNGLHTTCHVLVKIFSLNFIRVRSSKIVGNVECFLFVMNERGEII
jgi:hypothetical protein